MSSRHIAGDRTFSPAVAGGKVAAGGLDKR